MSFLPPQPEQQPTPQPQREEASYQPMLGKIPGVLGVPVAIPGGVLTTDKMALTMDMFIVYEEGFFAVLRAVARPGGDFALYSFASGGPQRSTLSRDRMLWGLEFSDGRRGYAPDVETTDGADFLIVPHGGGGSAWAVQQRYWVSAIPSPGPVTLHVAWDEAGLPETRVQIDAGPIVSACDAAEPVWRQ